jgi:hypothetical protein
MATRFLKKWVRLARPADPSRLYLPTTEGGLGLPAISTCYQKQQASVASLLLTSPDPIIQHTAKLAVMKEENLRRPLHRPMLEVREIWQTHVPAGSLFAREPRPMLQCAMRTRGWSMRGICNTRASYCGQLRVRPPARGPLQSSSYHLKCSGFL